MFKTVSFFIVITGSALAPSAMAHADGGQTFPQDATIAYGTLTRHGLDDSTDSAARKLGHTAAAAASTDPKNIFVTNSCGVETGTFRITKTLDGPAVGDSVSLESLMGENCNFYWLEAVKRYALVLEPGHDGMQYDPDYSSEIWTDRKLGDVVVNPLLIRKIKESQPALVQPLCCLDRKQIMDALREMDEEMWGGDPSDNILMDRYSHGSVLHWSQNPLGYKEGVTLKDFETWISVYGRHK